MNKGERNRGNVRLEVELKGELRYKVDIVGRSPLRPLFPCASWDSASLFLFTISYIVNRELLIFTTHHLTHCVTNNAFLNGIPASYKIRVHP